jgi:hypothetical protein
MCFWLDALNHSLPIFFLVHKLGGYDPYQVQDVLDGTNQVMSSNPNNYLVMLFFVKIPLFLNLKIPVLFV